MLVQDTFNTHGQQPPSKQASDALLWGIISVAIVAVLARLYCRLVLTRARGIDDVLVVVGLLFLIVSGVFRMITIDADRHIFYMLAKVSPIEFQLVSFQNKFIDALGLTARWSHCMATIQSASTAFTKCSILVFYMRFVINVAARRAIYGLMGFISATSLWYILNNWLNAKPFAAIWTPQDYPGATLFVHPKYLDTIFLSIQVLIDLIILALPVHKIFTMRIPNSKKVGVAIVYSTGFLSLAATLVALRYLIRFQWQSKGLSSFGGDVVLCLWSAQFSGLEAASALVCACMPALTPLFRQCTPLVSKLSSSLGSRYRSIVPPRSGGSGSYRSSSEPGICANCGCNDILNMDGSSRKGSAWSLPLNPDAEKGISVTAPIAADGRDGNSGIKPSSPTESLELRKSVFDRFYIDAAAVREFERSHFDRR